MGAAALVVGLFLTVVSSTSAKDLDLELATANKTGRVFSLFRLNSLSIASLSNVSSFSIVQFPNAACSSTSGTYSNGWKMNKNYFLVFILSCLEPASLRLSALQRVAQLRATVPLVSVCAVYVSYLSMRCTPWYLFVQVSVSATGSKVSQNCSYIVNPSFPRFETEYSICYVWHNFSNYAPTSTPATLTYTIEKCSSG